MAELNWEETAGKYFGYPKCCIEHFKERVARLDAGEEVVELSQKLGLVTHGSGFIPCDEHTKMLHEGRITLEELLVDRVCTREFPNDTLSEFKEYMGGEYLNNKIFE